MKIQTTFTEPVPRVSCIAAALWLALAFILAGAARFFAATDRTWTGGSATSTAPNWSGGVAGDIQLWHLPTVRVELSRWRRFVAALVFVVSASIVDAQSSSSKEIKDNI